jgi:hypothetical protein
MYLDLEREHLCLLERLVERRLAEVEAEAEARRPLEAAATTALAVERERLHRILHQLHECECDVFA